MKNEDMARIVAKHNGKRLTPVKAIKNYCKEMCCAGDQESWKNCTLTNCFLFRYRLGKGNRVSMKNRADSPIKSDKTPNLMGGTNP